MPKRGETKRAGIIEVAELAGVSRQTVTRAMNDMPGISAQTKRRVLEAAEQLRYRPSRFGRELVQQSARSLGLIVSDLANPYFSELASEFAKIAAANQWALVIIEKHPGPDTGWEQLRTLVGQVDAAIAYTDLAPHDIDRIFGSLPLVLLDAAERTLNALSPSRPRSAVNIDLAPGLAAVLDHLVGSGRSRIALVDIRYPTDESVRRETFARLVRDRGREPVVIEVEAGDDDLLVGRRAVQIAFDAPHPPDAIIAFNDMSAFGVLKELRVRDLAVPEACAVVGIDGLKIGVFVEPELTTLRLDFAAFAQLAFDEVVNMCATAPGAPQPPIRRHVSHELVVRQSG
ncbi:LacI family transcriptional regulator [Kitasatospora indigofera]|uniref:LacI family transcriptional regulator n=1 Tax=Kitasatospora indigofera TaxID=67307 RepID=A0A918YWQ3_9ACTN|nr:LacI family DNA-binding transcriptional regulator [Kitasatospora indigofera]GHE26296.1 LacI family transcriptional regulator [Kitasatospora indigofera]